MRVNAEQPSDGRAEFVRSEADHLLTFEGVEYTAVLVQSEKRDLRIRHPPGLRMADKPVAVHPVTAVPGGSREVVGAGLAGPLHLERDPVPVTGRENICDPGAAR
ncbi:hypothetical protein GCM10009717_21270 [Agromyces allii]|uniref:Uncharacterized protein n=1 Tax=Agromyces allii TaxID=393607 RepID=A0ABN2QMC8_9MICO